jgi:hypothetical protein
MATKRNTTIEVPGEPASDPTPAAAEPSTSAPSQEDASPATAAPDVPEVTPNPEPVTDAEKKRELDRQVRATAKLVGSSEALDWGHLTNPHDLAGKVNTYVDPDKDLPNVNDVDWSKVQGNKILTKQGWLLKA